MKPFLFLLVFLSSLFIACEKDSDSSEGDFDRPAFLQRVLQDFIIADFQQQKALSDALHSANLAFINAPSETSLAVARTAWTTAYAHFQNVNSFNFGPAAEQGLSKSLNEEIATFPVSITKIESRISSGTFSMSDFDRDARGFLTIEYLLFGSAATDAGIVARVGQDSFSEFLSAASENITSRIDAVESAWDVSTQEAFVANDGTDAGSSISAYYNEYVKSFEGLKNFKLGLPLGLRPGQTQTEPERIEARFSPQGIALLKADYESVKSHWFGTSENNGFRYYLQNVTEGETLIASTEAQFSILDQAFSAVSNEEFLIGLVENEDARMVTIHTELQRLTRFLKSDMSSLMGIAITFSSGDGD